MFFTFNLERVLLFNEVFSGYLNGCIGASSINTNRNRKLRLKNHVTRDHGIYRISLGDMNLPPHQLMMTMQIAVPGTRGDFVNLAQHPL